MKRLYLIALFIIVSLTATAQENGNRDAQNRIVRGPYETNRFFDNIFVGVAGGVNIYFGEHDSSRQIRQTAWPRHWTSMSENGSRPRSAHASDTPACRPRGGRPQALSTQRVPTEAWFKEKFGVSYLHADAMWNFSNAVSGYKEDPHLEFRTLRRSGLGAFLRQRHPRQRNRLRRRSAECRAPLRSARPDARSSLPAG